jgi:hypothetical protein
MRQIKILMSNGVAKYLSVSWVDFNKALRDLMAFDIIFKIIVAVLFAPFLSGVSRERCYCPSGNGSG